MQTTRHNMQEKFHLCSHLQSVPNIGWDKKWGKLYIRTLCNTSAMLKYYKCLCNIRGRGIQQLSRSLLLNRQLRRFKQARNRSSIPSSASIRCFNRYHVKLNWNLCLHVLYFFIFSFKRLT